MVVVESGAAERRNDEGGREGGRKSSRTTCQCQYQYQSQYQSQSQCPGPSPPPSSGLGSFWQQSGAGAVRGRWFRSYKSELATYSSSSSFFRSAYSPHHLRRLASYSAFLSTSLSSPRIIRSISVLRTEPESDDVAAGSPLVSSAGLCTGMGVILYTWSSRYERLKTPSSLCLAGHFLLSCVFRTCDFAGLSFRLFRLGIREFAKILRRIFEQRKSTYRSEHRLE